MNIFEFYGLPADHRKEKKIYQLVKNFEDVNPLVEQGILHKKVSWPMFGQLKEDGVFCAVAVRDDGEVRLFNRTGKLMPNTHHVAESYFQAQIEPGLYFGEILSTHECSLEELGGCINPLRVKPLRVKVDKKDGSICDQPAIAAGLYISHLDAITVNEFIEGFSATNYADRHSDLIDAFDGAYFKILPYVVINNWVEAQDFAEQHINAGKEGAVFKQNVGYLCGAKDWHQMKIVRGMHVDLECISFEEGTGKYKGLVANLYFRYANGVELKAMPGKGWTHDSCEALYQAGINNTADSPIGKIYHVAGLQPSSKNGLIRIPKVREERQDKSEPDFLGVSMELQELFSTVVNHLRKQGKPAQDDEGQCVYRNDEGCMCAVGVLIKEDVYSDEIEGNSLFNHGVQEALR